MKRFMWSSTLHYCWLLVMLMSVLVTCKWLCCQTVQIEGLEEERIKLKLQIRELVKTSGHRGYVLTMMWWCDDVMMMNIITVKMIIIITASNSNYNKCILSDFIFLTSEEAHIRGHILYGTFSKPYCICETLLLIYRTISLGTDTDCLTHPEIESRLFW